jgi:hypothetical protein
MGLDSFVIGFGPFSRDIVNCLDYSEDFYEGTKEGTIVFTTFFQCNTSSQSRELAEALGCDVWDFNTHKVDISKVNLDQLMLLFPRSEVSDFLQCYDKGFVVFYQPNG